MSYWKYIDTDSYSNAKEVHEAAPYPLIILSHGMGTGMVLHASQAEELASHGYVVAAIDHTYSTLATIFPDGRLTDYRDVLDEDLFLEQGRNIGKVWSESILWDIPSVGLRRLMRPTRTTGSRRESIWTGRFAVQL
nr:hypothetical protein [Paenibacillus cellulositrophicus]